MVHQEYEQSTVFICSGPRSCGIFKFLWAGVEPEAVIEHNSFFPRQKRKSRDRGISSLISCFEFSLNAFKVGHTSFKILVTGFQNSLCENSC